MSDSNDEAQASRARQAADPDSDVGGIAADRLRSIVDRIERLEEERKALGEDIKDIYAEAKSAGFKSPRPDILIHRLEDVRASIPDNSVILAGALSRFKYIGNSSEQGGL